MINFNVGPSKLNDNVKQDLKDAIDEGIGEISHRSTEFTQISKDAITGLRKYLEIPDDYYVFYTSSATDAMQIALMNTCDKESFHFVCGSFSKRFSSISKLLGKTVFNDQVKPGKINDIKTATIPASVDFVSITHNETSTGVMYQAGEIAEIKKKHPQAILAVDITSSAACVALDIKSADIWFFSVQKGFGLPAGLGIIIVSPRAFEKSINLTKENKTGLMNLPKMQEKMKDKYFTIPTPNILNIYLLSKQLERFNKESGQKEIHNFTMAKYKKIEEIIDKNPKIDWFIKNKDYRSPTSLCLKANPETINRIHQLANENKIKLGNGYGDLKTTTFRIANFPAITSEDVSVLIKLLQ